MTEDTYHTRYNNVRYNIHYDRGYLRLVIAGAVIFVTHSTPPVVQSFLRSAFRRENVLYKILRAYSNLVRLYCIAKLFTFYQIRNLVLDATFHN